MKPGFPPRIFNVSDQESFHDAAMKIFEYQADTNKVYSDFLQGLKILKGDVTKIEEIPFLPVELFKNHIIISGKQSPERIFESSGTTGSSVSRHHVADIGIYEESYSRAFRLFYGEPSDYIIAALLPSYTERENSSLVYMMNGLIKQSGNSSGGFFINNTDELLHRIKKWKSEKQKIMVVGVSFALLDLAEEISPDLSGVIVMETGGMKGRRKEITRAELHSVLKEKLNITNVHSEYGMTELLSQAYSKGNGLFQSPPWMKILIRDHQDPLSIIEEPYKTGGINIIDLANINSCSFISTGDLGRKHKDGSFEVLGRFDNSDIRGCNLLID
jgi:phenylacetate-coenzyme A ligase PaaK-like adenylate-forming protein